MTCMILLTLVNDFSHLKSQHALQERGKMAGQPAVLERGNTSREQGSYGESVTVTLLGHVTAHLSALSLQSMAHPDSGSIISSQMI